MSTLKQISKIFKCGNKSVSSALELNEYNLQIWYLIPSPQKNTTKIWYNYHCLLTSLWYQI